ncbi:MAG: DUF229 domain-containing protein [Alphaproteobacteria bacterium]|nr:DUF229 domain-containing protein [Alphaproteobacteria bacterium]
MAETGIDLPSWSHGGSDRLGPVATVQELDRIRANLLNLQAGDAIFAHLMLPHYPYVFRRDCSARPVHEWMARFPGDRPYPESNSNQGRIIRYEAYLEQMECLHSMLGTLFDEMRERNIFDKSVIIIHGDHGSRINLIEPTASHIRALSPQDFVDGFSTILAIKAPNISPEYDLTRISIQAAFAHLWNHELATPMPGPKSDAGEPAVHILDLQSRAVVPVQKSIRHELPDDFPALAGPTD